MRNTWQVVKKNPDEFCAKSLPWKLTNGIICSDHPTEAAAMDALNRQRDVLVGEYRKELPMATTVEAAWFHLKPMLSEGERELVQIKLRKVSLRAEHTKLDIIAREIGEQLDKREQREHAEIAAAVAAATDADDEWHVIGAPPKAPPLKSKTI